MADAPALKDLRNAIRAQTLADEADLARRLIAEADIGADRRQRAQKLAADFVVEAREHAGRSSLIDKFLQEYGLSTTEGVTLMRLAEALLRTPDTATADALIEDKVEAGDWAAHRGKSPFPLVNFSTRGLMVAAAWLDDNEATGPAGKLLKSTKKLIDKVSDPVIRIAVGQAMRLMGEHFVLGQTIEEAMRRGEPYAERGYLFSFDMLGEAARTAADAEHYFDDYESAIAAIALQAREEDAVDNPGISVKLSALHPRYELAKKERVMGELGLRVRRLALDAKQANIGFNIDAEEADRLDISLDLIESIMRDPAFDGWTGFGVVVQAYQRRAMPVLDWLAQLARETGRRITVRLVKGAYWDSEIKRAQVQGLASYPVFTRKVLTDVSFHACARRLLSHRDVIYPQFATHNALTAAMAREMAGEYDRYELQRLYGMGEELHDRLLERGARSRIYAPVGGHRELLPYLVRRLLENGANSSFVNQLIDPDLSVEDVVADPVDEALELDILPNPAIPVPCDLFNGERLGGRGEDLGDPHTVDRLERAVSEPFSPPLAVGPIIAGREETDQGVEAASPIDPARIVATVRAATPDDVDAAIRSARKAQTGWNERPAAARAEALTKAADLLEARMDAFMRLATQEAGKSIPDGIAEVREAVDFLRYYAHEATQLSQPARGVIVCISPWNFPLAIFVGQVAAALVAGNAVIAKPAEQTPAIAAAAVKLLHEAGIPPNVLHFLPGDGPTVGGPLTRHRDIDGVIFTGSTAVAQIIDRSLAEANPEAVLIAETGGINAMIVDSTALLEQAVADTVASAFQSAGQRCSACRLVCVQDDIAGRFNQMLAGAMAELTVGDPAALATDVGPVIDQEAHGIISDAIAALRQKNGPIAETSLSGDPDTTGAGHFIAPIAFAVDGPSAVDREIFGPVLQVANYPAGGLHKLIDEINALGYGLTMGVHSRIDETMHDVVSRARIGNIYVNRNQIGAVVGVQPFGGEGLSGTGPKAGGPHYLPHLTVSPQGAEKPVEITSKAPPALYDQKIKRALDAQKHWSYARDRQEIFARASAGARGEAADILKTAASIARDIELPTDLPGPTGEANSLRLRGRGVIACLGPDSACFAAQAARALGTGNAIVADEALSGDLARAIAEAGGPAGLVEGMPLGGAIPETVISDARLAAIAIDADADGRARLRRLLAAREGARAPLLTSSDSAARYANERTVTVNTTAAGGDVQLLALPE